MQDVRERTMAQISFVSGSSFFAFDEQASKADRFAASVRAAKGGLGVNAQLGGARVAVDRMSAAASTGLGAEVQALSSATANTAEGVSMLQVAEAALSEISDKLERTVTLSVDAKSASRSEFERAQYDAEFQTLLAEIDEIATNTEFNGTNLLQGNGVGGALQINYKVGTGNSAGDEIAVTINATSVSDLSASLASADLQSVDNATTARTSVATAQAALGEIQGAVSGKLTGFASAAENSSSMAGRHEQARAQRAQPAVVIDLAEVVAGRISKEQGIDLNSGDVATMRKLVLDLNSSFVGTAATQSTTDTGGGVVSGSNQAADSGSSGDRSESSGSPKDNDRDAA